MAANNQSIKDAFALSSNRPAITNAHLTRLVAVMEGTTPDDFWDETYDYWRDRILHRERSLAEDQLPTPTEL